MTDFQCSMRTFQVVLAMIALVPSALVLTINGQEIVWKEEESRKFESKAASLPERFWNDGTPLMLLDDEKDDDPPDCNDTHSSRYDPLACWLQQLKVAIPDQEFKKSFFKVVRFCFCVCFCFCFCIVFFES